MPLTLACVKAGVTLGEWSDILRNLWGEYRPPTGISGVQMTDNPDTDIQDIRNKLNEFFKTTGRRAKILLGKPGLDGHSNGIEQIAVMASQCGFEVVYEGIRLTPRQIVNCAVEEDVHLIGLSVLSGSHLNLAEDVLHLMQTEGVSHIPLIMGGIIPEQDEKSLLQKGVRKVYTPKNFELIEIMKDFVEFCGG